MKLNTQTGSLTNHLLSRAVNGQPEPEIGMGATILAWTDRHAGTITEIVSGARPIVTVQEDSARRVDSNGMSESQEYEYTPNPNGSRSYFRRADNGTWQEVRRNPETGRWNRVDGGGCGLRIGERRAYHDFSF